MSLPFTPDQPGPPAPGATTDDGGTRDAAGPSAGNGGVGAPGRRDFSNLDLPECLVIKSFRLWLHGPENWTYVGMQYKAHFGTGSASVAMIALKGLIEELNGGARRPMQFMKVWCRGTTGDERAIIALLAAVQAEDWHRARAMADRMVEPRFQARLLDHAENLASAFRAKGHRFVHLSARGQAISHTRGPAPIETADANSLDEAWLEVGD